MPRVSLPAAPASRRKHEEKPGVAQRQALDDLAGVKRGQGHLAGSHQVEVVVGQVVDLLLGVGKEARPVERLLADEHGRDDGLEAVADELLRGPAHERELEQDHVAAQVGEARARQARAALHVDALAGQLEVVGAGRACLADLAQDLVLVCGGRVGQVGQRDEHRLELVVGAARGLAERLDLRGDVLHAGDRFARVVARLLGRRDAL